MAQLIENLSVCPECGCTRIEKDKIGEQVCGGCGLVIADLVIDQGPEWQGEMSNASRGVGLPLRFSQADLGLSTQITNCVQVFSGRKIKSNRPLLTSWAERLLGHSVTKHTKIG